MKIRAISGACFIAIVSIFFVLRQYVNYRLFDVLIWFFTAVGTFEMARAFKDRLTKSSFILAIVYGVIFVPCYALIENVVWKTYGWVFALSFIIVFCTVAFEVQGGVEKKGSIVGIYPILYPSALLLALLLTNRLQLGFIALLLIFVISPLADTFAYLVGMTYSKIKKGKVKRLCPKLSPKKTVAGAIGGLVGGIVGSILVYVIFTPQISSNVPILIFAIIGLFASVLTEVGDLFESFIKRRVGIKDMGKIMPGHGGVLDRIDGMSFAGVGVFIIFLFL